jgi:uncharacterized protein
MFRFLMGKAHQILQKSLIWAIKGYQYALSPFLGCRCRFYPTCSQYAVDALTYYNLVVACYFIFRRLLRCHPFHPGGHDPLLPSSK